MKRNIEIVAALLCALTIIASLVWAISFFVEANNLHDQHNRSGYAFSEYGSIYDNSVTYDSSNELSLIFLGIGVLVGGAFGAWCVYVLVSGFAAIVGSLAFIEEKMRNSDREILDVAVDQTPQEKCDVVRDVVYTCKGCGQEKLCKELRVTNENGQTRYVHYCDECLKNN